MPDDLFARVARWWDRDALITERMAVAGLAGFDPDGPLPPWAELAGDERWRLVQAMRGLVRLADELREVMK